MSAVSKVIRDTVLTYCKENPVVHKPDLESYVAAIVKQKTLMTMMPGLAWAEAMSMLASGQVQGMEQDGRLGVAKVAMREPVEPVDPRQEGFGFGERD